MPLSPEVLVFTGGALVGLLAVLSMCWREVTPLVPGRDARPRRRED